MVNNALVFFWEALNVFRRRLSTYLTPFVTLTYLLTFCKFFKIHQLPQACSSISTSSLLSLTFPCWFCWTLLKKFLISKSAWRTIGKRSSKFCTTRGAFFMDLELSNEKRCHMNKWNQYIYRKQTDGFFHKALICSLAAASKLEAVKSSSIKNHL